MIWDMPKGKKNSCHSYNMIFNNAYKIFNNVTIKIKF